MKCYHFIFREKVETNLNNYKTIKLLFLDFDIYELFTNDFLNLHLEGLKLLGSVCVDLDGNELNGLFDAHLFELSGLLVDSVTSLDFVVVVCFFVVVSFLVVVFIVVVGETVTPVSGRALFRQKVTIPENIQSFFCAFNNLVITIRCCCYRRRFRND